MILGAEVAQTCAGLMEGLNEKFLKDNHRKSNQPSLAHGFKATSSSTVAEELPCVLRDCRVGIYVGIREEQPGPCGGEASGLILVSWAWVMVHRGES